jgi:UDP-N-acetyl-D-glucosamine dehydrogenase
VQNALNDRGKALKGSRIHIVGVAYKRDIDDVRESPAIDIIHLLRRRGAIVTYSDPYVPSIRIEDETLSATEMSTALGNTDCAVIITDHAGVDYSGLTSAAPLIVDTRNALRGVASQKIIRL